MTRVYVDVTDRETDGPVTNIIDVNVNRIFNGPGTFALTVPATDERAKTILTPDTQVAIYVIIPGQAARQLTAGYIIKTENRISDGGFVLAITGADNLWRWKWQTIGYDAINNSFSSSNLNTLFTSIVDNFNTYTGLSWTKTSVGSTGSTSANGKFQFISNLKAMQDVARTYNVNFRWNGGTEIKYGYFTASTALTDDDGQVYRATNVPTISPRLYDNNGIAIIRAVTKSHDVGDAITRVYPVTSDDIRLDDSQWYGGGEPGDYTIQTTTRIGSPDYYLDDTSGSASSFRRETYKTYSTISALGTSVPDRQDAADSLYNASDSWLSQVSQPQYTYSLSLLKCNITIRAGDKLRVIYSGIVTTRDGTFTYEDIDDYFYVTSVRERVDLSGLTTEVEAKNFALVNDDIANRIAKQIPAKAYE